jgi:hypothetical protein
MQVTRYTTQQQLYNHSQLQQPPQIQSHSLQTTSDVSVEFTRRAPHNHSQPASPIQFSALAQSQQPTTMQVTRYTTVLPLTASATTANTITLTRDIQRRQCRVHTQCAAQPLASSVAHPVPCPRTITAAHDHANNSRHNATAATLPFTASAATANAITLTSDIQRRQCRVYTQCAAQPLASSVADPVPCSRTITATHDDASHSIHNKTAAVLPLAASATTANTIALTFDIQRRQCRVHTQCAAQPLASSVADPVPCSNTITATHDNASHSIHNATAAALPFTASAATNTNTTTHIRHSATSVSSSHAGRRTTSRIQRR